jgi:hypothetical protein
MFVISRIFKEILMEEKYSKMLDELLRKFSTKDNDVVRTPASKERIPVKYTLGSVFKAFNEDLMLKIESDERGRRLNELVGLTKDESSYYMSYILVQRIKYVNGERVNLGLLQELMIPAFFACAISCIGMFRDSETGIEIVPSTDDTTEYDEARIREIGDKFYTLKDVYASTKGAWMHSREGDPDVMRMACVQEQVVSMSGTSHPLRTYLAAFLDATIATEIAERGLYRMRYDAVDTILHIMRGEGMNVC